MRTPDSRHERGARHLSAFEEDEGATAKHPSRAARLAWAALLTKARSPTIRRRRVQVTPPSGGETEGVRATKREKDEIRVYVELSLIHI